MLSITRGTDRPPVEGRRRSRTALGLSVAVNAVVIAAFFQTLTGGVRQWVDLFGPVGAKPVPVEKVVFVQAPKPTGPAVRGRSGGDGRPVTKKPAAPAPQAPSTVPDAIPPANPTAAPVETGGSGAVVGSGGALEGIRPSYGDARIWAPAGRPAAPRSAQGQLDSVVADIFTGVRDSILAAQTAAEGQRKPGDWTMKGPGGKWGMDQTAIRLGKLSIPNAILALLSENLQKNLRGNPIQMAEDRRLAAVRADLLQHAQREMNEDAFRQAVKDIRARKDRERAVRVAGDRGAVRADPAPAAAVPTPDSR
jgi:hypothetical protein